jgi:DNA replicative helicase MCM subunit Mcm2 (Cdc46/Mcm family)
LTVESYLQKISEEYPLDYLSQFICPYLVGREWEWIRRATLLMMVTQSDKHTRVRIHILLCGAPGTGKTEFLLWMREHLQGVMINAELTSKIGLVGDARGNKITPGLLADCTGNIVLADELDKASANDQSGLLQAMEEGQYTIVKGKSRQRFDSEVRVLGCANVLKKIQKPLLDRFDFVLFVRPSKRSERANNVKRIMNTFIGKEETKYTKVIQGYLKWIDGHNTTIPDSEEEAINNIIREYILNTQTKIDSVSYRSLELSILRIAYAMAKLEKRSIGREHIKRSIRVKDQILKNLVG